MDTLFDVDAVSVASSKSNEWYTKRKYIEAARNVMGSIDLDPASCTEANKTVKAMRYFTEQDNGLLQDWECETCWLNPPYGRANDSNAGYSIGRRLGGGKSIASLFVKRLIDEYKAGRIKQAILLVTSDTDAAWFVPLWEYSICFAAHRVLFHRPGLEDQGQFFGSCFVYLGPHATRFAHTFSEFGPVVLPSSVYRRPQPIIQTTFWNKEQHGKAESHDVGL